MSETTKAPRPRTRVPFDRKQLTRLRSLAGLQQKELAERSGLSAQHISRLEKGDVGPSPDTVHRLAGALGCEPADLMTAP